MKIRPARVSDVKTMHSLIGFYADRKEMLPRSINDLYENIQEFTVVESGGNVMACCALHVSWEDLAEIKALAVAQGFQRKGVGTRLVATLEKKAKELGVKRLFALTFKPDFFVRLGYRQISREKLPHKIWGECVKCPLFPDCGEIPLIKDINATKRARAKRGAA